MFPNRILATLILSVLLAMAGRAQTPGQAAPTAAGRGTTPAPAAPAAPGPPVPTQKPPTRADILRGEYGRYRANNDLLFYRLDVRVDPEKKSIAGKNTIRFRMLEGRHAHPARSLRQPRRRPHHAGRHDR